MTDQEVFRIYDCCEHCEHGIHDPPHLERCPEGCGDEGDEARHWPCCRHCDHDPGLRHAGPCWAVHGLNDDDRS